jgi:hypothetical protein
LHRTIKAPRVQPADRPRSERASVRSRHTAAVRSTAPQPAPPFPMPHVGRSTLPSWRPPPQRVPQGHRRHRRADACPARRPAGQGRCLPCWGHPPPSPPCARGSSRERLPPRLASFSSSCSTPRSATDAALTIPSASLRQAVQAASTPVRARCAAASVPPRPRPVPPALLLTPCSASATHHVATDEAVCGRQVTIDPIHPLLQVKRAAGHEET